MLEKLRSLFGLRDRVEAFQKCEACAARIVHIESLSMQVGFLQDALRELQQQFVRPANKVTQPIQQIPQPWSHMKKKLEEKYARGAGAKPEDEVEKYWKEKIPALEDQILGEKKGAS